eukprot:1177418-Prorocentrum_minimum.AAC.1
MVDPNGRSYGVRLNKRIATTPSHPSTALLHQAPLGTVLRTEPSPWDSRMSLSMVTGHIMEPLPCLRPTGALRNGTVTVPETDRCVT